MLERKGEKKRGLHIHINFSKVPAYGQRTDGRKLMGIPLYWKSALHLAMTLTFNLENCFSYSFSHDECL